MRISIVVLIASCAGMPPSGACGGETPHNIILFIGDGMGVAHVTAAKIAGRSLHLERLRTAGFVTTFAENDLITDSAASGTAMATGFKSYNGAISVSFRQDTLKTVLEYAEEAGMSTGLVVTCSITHATPAVFASHVASRNSHNEIAAQMTASGVDVMIGGGWSYFVPKAMQGSRRTDDRNLLDELRTRMDVVLSIEEFRALGEIERLAAFFAPRHLPKVDGRGIPLAELTVKAIDALAHERNGFFLMVEGSQIDWAGHDNDSRGIIAEMIDFDDAVGIGMDFAGRHGETLVIVTSDHETGGYAVLDGSVTDATVTSHGFASSDHTAEMVPIFAHGPGAGTFGGIIDNSDIGRALIEFVRDR
jgi:alkaline phosphatase